MDIGCSWIHGYREGSVVRELTDELGVVSHVLDRVLADADPWCFRNATFRTRAKAAWSLKAVRRSLTSRITLSNNAVCRHPGSHFGCKVIKESSDSHLRRRINYIYRF